MKNIILFLFLMFFAVTAKAVPTRITNLTVVSVTGSKVVLTCTVPSANVTQIELRSRAPGALINALNYASSPIVATVNNPGSQGTVVTFTITNLSNYSTYYFAAKAKDTVWCSTISNTFAGTTLGPYKNIFCQWHLKDDGGSMPTAYFIEWGTTPEMLNSPIIVNSGTTYTATIPNLTWGVGYYWRVVSWNAVGSKQCIITRYDNL